MNYSSSHAFGPIISSIGEVYGCQEDLAEPHPRNPCLSQVDVTELLLLPCRSRGSLCGGVCIDLSVIAGYDRLPSNGLPAKHSMDTLRVRSILLMPLAVSLALAGCSHTADVPVIAVIPQAAPEQLWETVHDGAQLAAKENTVQIYWNAPDREDDVQRQIALVDKVAHGDYAGLVLAPTQELALMMPVRRALQRGLPVVVIDSPLTIQPGVHLAYVLNDEIQTGALAAASIGGLLHGKGRVAVLGIDPAQSGLMARLHAFELALYHNDPNVAITVRKLGSFDSIWSEQAAKEALEVHPHVDAILTLNVPATFGAYRAELSLPRGLRPKIVACDQEAPLFTLLRNGGIQTLIAQDALTMGYRAVDEIMRMRRGQPVPAYVHLEPIVVTAENVDDPNILRRVALLPGAPR